MISIASGQNFATVNLLLAKLATIHKIHYTFRGVQAKLQNFTVSRHILL